MVMSMEARRVLGAMCFLMGALFAAIFALVAISKVTALSGVAIAALVLYGAGAVTFIVAGRALLRHR